MLARGPLSRPRRFSTFFRHPLIPRCSPPLAASTKLLRVCCGHGRLRPACSDPPCKYAVMGFILKTSFMCRHVAGPRVKDTWSSAGTDGFWAFGSRTRSPSPLQTEVRSIPHLSMDAPCRNAFRARSTAAKKWRACYGA